MISVFVGGALYSQLGSAVPEANKPLAPFAHMGMPLHCRVVRVDDPAERRHEALWEASVLGRPVLLENEDGEIVQIGGNDDAVSALDDSARHSSRPGH